MKLGVIIVLALAGLLFLKAICVKRRPFRCAFWAAASGLLGLWGLSALAPVTGLSVAFNFYTVSAALIFGLPGAAGVLLLHFV